MRHAKLSKRFGRNLSQRKALLNSLARNLLINERIITTIPKAKQAGRLVDKLISIAKSDTVKNQRRAYDILQDRHLVSVLFKEIAPLFKNRQGGYTRLIRTVYRKGDSAPMAILELVETKPKAAPKPKAVKEKQKEPPLEKEARKEEPKKEVKEEIKEVKEKREVPEKPKPTKEPAPKKPPRKGFLGGLRKFFRPQDRGGGQ